MSQSLQSSPNKNFLAASTQEPSQGSAKCGIYARVRIGDI